MARVNIEEEAWKRIYRLAEVVDCSVREAAGTVGCLWSQSQDLVKTHGTRAEILEWASLFKISDENTEKWILGLEKARFISRDENGVFKIHGNESQLESLASKVNRASKGGKALQKKMRELKVLKAGLKQATRGLQEAPRGSMQCNSMQDNAKQSNSNSIIIASSSAVAAPRASRETISISSFNDFDQILSQEVKANLYTLYPDFDFLKREFLKMHNWLIANPRKNQKTVSSWIKFVSSWLDKGWPSYQATIPSNKANHSNVATEEVRDRIRKLFGEAAHAS